MAIQNITTPDFGSAAEVTVIQVLVKPGDKIEADTPIVSLESDKATMDIPASHAGMVKEVKIKAGDQVKTGSLLLTLETGHGASHAVPKVEAVPPRADTPSPAKKDVSQGEWIGHEEGVHAGPGVRRLARELGVNLETVQGSGPKQRVLREDVLAHTKPQGSSHATPNFSLPAIDFSHFGETTLQPLSRIKRLSGKYLQRNWMMIPHVTQFGEADITSLEAYRVEQNVHLKKQNIRLTILPFVMKALIAALKVFPHFNASLDEASENLILKKYFHLGIAVDTEDGLLVPVIQHAERKGLIELAQELSALSERAKQKQLTPKELQGSSFSISSLGSIGGTAFTPIINYPDVAILGISQSSHKPVYEDGQFVPRLMLPLSLSYDHRVIDGAEAARFMVYLTTLLSDIRNLLL